MNTPDIGDLRPAPRRTPTAVLWILFVAAVAGTGLLFFEYPESEKHELAALRSAGVHVERGNMSPSTTKTVRDPVDHPVRR